MKGITKKLTSLVMLFFISFFTSGCAEKPDMTINRYLDALKRSDIKTASEYLYKNDSAYKGGLNFERPEQEKLAKLIFSKLDYNIISTTINGNNAIVKIKLTSPDLSPINAMMVTELYPKIFVRMSKGEDMDKSKVNSIVEDYYMSKLGDINITTYEQKIDIKLIKNKKNWLINSDDDLANALTSNLFNFYSSIFKICAEDSSTIYQIQSCR